MQLNECWARNLVRYGNNTIFDDKLSECFCIRFEFILNLFLGVENFKINLEEKKVFVTSTLSPEEVLESIKKTGKTVSYIGVQN